MISSNSLRCAYVRAALVTALLVAIFQAEARASFIPYLTSAMSGTYTYNLVFNTTGATGSSNPAPEVLVSTDFVTLYDIAVPGTVASVSLQGSHWDSRYCYCRPLGDRLDLQS